MTGSRGFLVRPIGRVESPLRDRRVAPKQSEAAPEAWLVFDEAVRPGWRTSADRPNPIGLHRVEILALRGSRLRVNNMEAVDGTPILDVKPVQRRSEG